MTDQPSTRLIAIALAALMIGSVAVAGVAVAGEHQQAGNDDGEELSAQQSSYLRLVHAAPDAPPVDVMVDNETVVSGLGHGNVTDYQKLPAGNHSVQIVAADDTSEVFFEGAVYIEARAATTLAATAAQPAEGNESTQIRPVMFVDNAWEPDENSSALSAVHLASDAPAVDVTIPAEQMAEDPAAVDQIGNETTAANETDDGNETEPIGENETLGDNETEDENVTFGENETEDENVTVGENETEDENVTIGENETEDGNVTVGENETMAGNETLGENETVAGNETMAGNETDQNLIVVGDNLQYASASDYISVPEGTHTLQIREAAPDNNGTILETVNVTVQGGTAHSALVLGNATQDAAGNVTMDTPANETEDENVTVGDNETIADNETEDENVTVGDNETADENVTFGENETEDENVTIGENETEDENVTIGENETMAGNETLGENETAGTDGTDSLMVEITDDATYTIHLPDEQPPTESVNETDDLGEENETVDLDETDEIADDENETAAGNETGADSAEATETPV